MFLEYADDDAWERAPESPLFQDGDLAFAGRQPIQLAGEDLGAWDEVVIVDFAKSRVTDQSALSAVEGLSAAYRDEGKSIRLRHLSRDCYRLLSKTGLLFDEADDDPDYQVATDYSVRVGLFEGAH